MPDKPSVFQQLYYQDNPDKVPVTPTPGQPLPPVTTPPAPTSTFRQLYNEDNPPSSADQTGPQGITPGAWDRAGNAAQGFGVGLARGAANLGSVALQGGPYPTGTDAAGITGPGKSLRDVADENLPEPKNQVAARAGEDFAMGLPMGMAGAVTSAAAGAGTEYLNQVRPDSPVANAVEPAVAAMLFAPGMASSLVKLGTITGAAALKKFVDLRPSLVQAKEAQDITKATGASTTDSDSIRKIQRSMREVLGGGNINKTTEEEQAQLGEAVNRQADKLGTASTKQEAGEAIGPALEDGVGAVKNLIGRAYQALDTIVPQSKRIPMQPVVDEMIQKLSPGTGTENTLNKLGYNPDELISAFMDDVIKSSKASGGTGNTLTLANVKKLKGEIGEKLEETTLNGDLTKTQYETMYGVLANAEASAYAGTPAEAAYQRIKTTAAEMYKAMDEHVQPLLKMGATPENIAQSLSNGMKLGDSKLSSALDMIEASSPGIKGEYQSMILRSLGLNQRKEFDSNLFFNNWQKISPEAKMRLFGQNGDLPKAYDQLALIAENQARGARAMNPSQTAGTHEIFNTLRYYGAAIGAGAGYELSNHSNNSDNNDTGRTLGGIGAGTAAMQILGFPAIAKLMTNPMFIRWLAEPTTIQQVPLHIKGLAAIAAEYPQDAQYINSFSDYAQKNLGAGGSTIEAVKKLMGYAEGGYANNPWNRFNTGKSTYYDRPVVSANDDPRGKWFGGNIMKGATELDKPGTSKSIIDMIMEGKGINDNNQFPIMQYAEGGTVEWEPESLSDRGPWSDYSTQHPPFDYNQINDNTSLIERLLSDKRSNVDFVAKDVQGDLVPPVTMPGARYNLTEENSNPFVAPDARKAIANYREGIRSRKSNQDTVRYAQGGSVSNPDFEKGVQTLTNLGVNPEVAKGAIHYMLKNESGLSATAENPSSHAYGKGQWLGSRKRELLSMYGSKPNDDQQWQFMAHELTTGKDGGGTLNALKNAKSERQGYEIWGTNFERPGPVDLAKALGRPINTADMSSPFSKAKSGGTSEGSAVASNEDTGSSLLDMLSADAEHQQTNPEDDNEEEQNMRIPAERDPVIDTILAHPNLTPESRSIIKQIALGAGINAEDEVA